MAVMEKGFDSSLISTYAVLRLPYPMRIYGLAQCLSFSRYTNTSSPGSTFNASMALPEYLLDAILILSFGNHVIHLLFSSFYGKKSLPLDLFGDEPLSRLEV